MSTPIRVRLASCAGLLVAACSGGVPVDSRVSYAGLDTPLEALDPPPIVVGIVADTTGPGAAQGRAFADGLKAALESASPLREREVRVHVLDDRSRPEGAAQAAARMETDLGVRLAIVQPGADRAARVAEVAGRTPVVCVGCDAPAATREGSFVLVVRAEGEAVRAGAEWVLAALRATPDWHSRQLATTLRATAAPAGAEAREGAEPARDPYLFRLPPAGGGRP